MNTGQTFKPYSLDDSEVGNSADLMAASAPTGELAERKNPAVSEYDTTTASNSRSIVERRFMRMNEAHDRIRTELLARPPREG